MFNALRDFMEIFKGLDVFFKIGKLIIAAILATWHNFDNL